MTADVKIQSKTYVSGSKSHGHGPFHLFKFLLYLWLQTQKFKVKPLCLSLKIAVMDCFICLKFFACIKYAKNLNTFRNSHATYFNHSPL